MFVTRNGIRIASLPLLRHFLCRYMSDAVIGEVFSKPEAEQIRRRRRQEDQRLSHRRTLAKHKRHQRIRTAKKRFTKRIRNPVVAFVMFVLRPVKCLWSFLVLFTRHTCSGLKNDALFWICLIAIPMFWIFATRRTVYVHMPNHHTTCSTSAAEADVGNDKDEAKVDDEVMVDDDEDDDETKCVEDTNVSCVNLFFDLPWTDAEPSSLPKICIAQCHSILNLKHRLSIQNKIPTDDLVLSHGGRTLENRFNVGHYDLSDDDVVTVHLRSSGGKVTQSDHVKPPVQESNDEVSRKWILKEGDRVHYLDNGQYCNVTVTSVHNVDGHLSYTVITLDGIVMKVERSKLYRNRPKYDSPRDPDTPACTSPHDESTQSRFEKGESVYYSKNGEKFRCTVASVHLEDGVPYYTVTKPDGGEKGDDGEISLSESSK